MSSSNGKIKIALSLFLSFLMILSSFSLLFTKVEAGGFFCGNVYDGAYFGNSFMKEGELLPNIGQRRYTFQEMFGRSVQIGTFRGERDDGLFFKERNVGLREATDNAGKFMLEKRGSSTVDACLLDPSGAGLSSLILKLSSIVTSVASVFVNSLFSSENPIIEAVSLIIGGENNEDGGLIGSLADGLYYPLMALAVLTGAIYLGYQGIVKRQYRGFLQSVIWLLIALALGVLIAEKPATIVGAPQSFTSAVTGCIMEGLKGGNCLTNTIENSPSSFIGDICISDSSSARVTDKTAFNTNSLSCGIWRSLVLNPWSTSQFGYAFDDLYTIDPPEGKTAFPLPEGVSPEDFCVPTFSSSSMSEIQNSSPGTLPGFDESRGRVCNIAGYQLAVQSGMFGTSEEARIQNLNKVALVAISNTAMFDTWGFQSGMHTYSFASLIASIFAFLSILGVTLQAHVYMFLSTLSLAFGPVFALFALHPGRGKKIFLGWLQSIISYVVKFIASAVVVIVTLALYSAVISNVNSISIIFVAIILSLSMKAYQSKFMELIGKVDLGGQRLASAVDEKIFNKAGKMKDSLQDKTATAAGTLIGAKVAAKTHGLSTGDDMKEKAAYYGGALKHAAIRGMNKSGNDVVRQSSRQYLRQTSSINAAKRKDQRELRDATRYTELENKRANMSEELVDAYEKFTEKNIEQMKTTKDYQTSKDNKAKFMKRKAEKIVNNKKKRNDKILSSIEQFNITEKNREDLMHIMNDSISNKEEVSSVDQILDKMDRTLQEIDVNETLKLANISREDYNHTLQNKENDSVSERDNKILRDYDYIKSDKYIKEILDKNISEKYNKEIEDAVRKSEEIKKQKT